MDDIMRGTKILSSISRLAVILIVFCIIPSGASAAENNPKLAPAQDISEENFVNFQAEVLDSISEQITELQSLYTNVSEASSTSELQEVMFIQVPAKRCGQDRMNCGPCEMSGFLSLKQTENITDDNYTDVQREIVNSIGNMTEILKEQRKNTNDENMIEMLDEQISELENLSTGVNEASSAAELQKVVLTYMKTKAVDSIEKEIKHIEVKVSKSENITDDTDGNITGLNYKITELTTLIDDINAANSLEDFKELTFSAQGMHGICHKMDYEPGPGKDSVQYERYYYHGYCR